MAFAGAWTLPSDTGQLIITQVFDQASQSYDASWQLSQDADFTKQETQLYWEHGLRDNLTVVLSGALQDVSLTSSEGPQSVSGLGTSLLATRYRLWSSSQSVLSVQTGILIAAEGEVIPDGDLGQGDYGAEFRVLYGRGFKLWGKDAFFDAQAAYVVRIGELPDSAIFDVSFGRRINRKSQLIAQLFAKATDSSQIGQDVILRNDTFKAQLSVVYDINANTSLQFGGFQTVFGRNALREQALILGVWRKY